MSKTLWKKIADSLREDIESGRLKTGDKVETEAQLTARWGVSAMTVHRAMRELSREGLVVRQQGRGTTVAPQNSKATGDVALIFHNWSNIFEFEYMRGINTSLAGDYRVAFYDANFDAAREAHLLQRASQETDGIICIPLCHEDSLPMMKKLVARDFPLVCLDRVPEGLDVAAVTSDNFGNSVVALRALIEKGHRRIVHFTEPDMCVSAVRERHEAFLQVMRENGEEHPEEWVRLFPFGRQPFESVLTLVQDTIFALWNRPDPFTAIFCLNDSSLAIVLAAAEKLGLPIPQDVEVLAFNDNITLTPMVEQRLNRIVQQPFEMGRQAAEMLKKRMNGENLETQNVCVSAEFHFAHHVRELR